jgi:ATP-binding protein involved in chromosome partitioning
VAVDPDDPAAQAVRQAARGLIALTPMALPVLQVEQIDPPAAQAATGMSLPMAG